MAGPRQEEDRGEERPSAAGLVGEKTQSPMFVSICHMLNFSSSSVQVATPTSSTSSLLPSSLASFFPVNLWNFNGTPSCSSHCAYWHLVGHLSASARYVLSLLRSPRSRPFSVLPCLRRFSAFPTLS